MSKSSNESIERKSLDHENSAEKPLKYEVSDQKPLAGGATVRSFGEQVTLKDSTAVDYEVYHIRFLAQVKMGSVEITSWSRDRLQQWAPEPRERGVMFRGAGSFVLVPWSNIGSVEYRPER